MTAAAITVNTIVIEVPMLNAAPLLRSSSSVKYPSSSRIDAGTYGVCGSCGQPIGKARLMAFPRAVLCVRCKQREERR